MTMIGFFFLLMGVSVFVVSAIGLLRMPDVYTRMHVGAKSPTVGTLFVVIGAIFIEPEWAFKLILLATFVLLTNPLSSSVIARASHKSGMRLENDECIDALTEPKEEKK
ncbi:MAG: Na+/H+ antiporter subunit G [Epsilonproteobacteria bacterium]|nr:MAG: Na+/H+ antiporter subunit G [Campylobacterota bacterium]